MPPKGFRCGRCGSCCYPPRLYPSDIKRIKKAGLKDFIFIDHRGFKYIDENQKGRCIFLKQKKIYSCAIYDARPRICRLYPSKLIDGDCRPVESEFDRHKKID